MAVALLNASSSLLFSSIVRYGVERNSLEVLLETGLIYIFAIWQPSIVAVIPMCFGFFLCLAFWNSRQEATATASNVREAQTDMCPGIGLAFNGCPHTPRTSKVDKDTKASQGSNVSNELRSNHDLVAGKSEQTLSSDLFGRPMIFPTRLYHTRLAPFKYKFSHSYVLAGVPVGLHECYSPLLCVDQQGSETRRWWWPFRRAWFNIRAQDHGIRGGQALSLAHKLREFLIFEGVNPDEFPFAFMIAVPSVNGHSNNPLGFWLLYNKERELTAVIPELNTSFDERRMWFVRRAADSPSIDSKSYNFRGHFIKDLHVSPFNPSTGGGYTIDVMDPLSNEEHHLAVLITLKAQDGSTLLLGRISSEGDPIDVANASLFTKLMFLVRWWWVAMGTITFGRILLEAGKIYLRFNPNTWRHPELGVKSLGRPARAVEKTLERYFRLHLKHYVENYPYPLVLNYKTPGEHSLREESFISSTKGKAQNVTSPKCNLLPKTMDFQVLTPAFYHRFFHYQDFASALRSELLDDEQRSHTVWASHPRELVAYISTIPNIEFMKMKLATPPGAFWHRLQWYFTSYLRATPPELNYPRSQIPNSFSGLSSLDAFVINNYPAKEVQEYRRALLRVYLGEQIASNWEVIGVSRDAVLSIYDALVRSVLLSLAIWAMAALTNMSQSGIGSGLDSKMKWIQVWASAAPNLWACLKAFA